MKGLVLRLAGAVVALMFLQALLGGVLLSKLTVEPGAPGWGLLSAALIAAMLLALACRQPRGLARAATLFAVWAAIQALCLVEAVFFPIRIPAEVWPRLIAFQMLEALGFAFVLDRLAGSGPGGPTAWPTGRARRSWLVRIAGATAAYVVAYTVAGYLVWPFVSDFYSPRPMPGTQAILMMQVARGLAFTGVVALILARTAAPPRTAALLSGLTLAILGGVAPLLVPNPFMPHEIRMPHLVEVGVSNFLFGVVGALLLSGLTASRPTMRGWSTTVSPSRSPSSAS